MKNFLKQCLAEFIGTFFLVFIGCGAVIVSELYTPLPYLAIPLAFGGVVSVMIYAVGHLSGAHFNPAVTLAFSIARHFPIKRVLGYVLSQVLGALLASFLHAVLLGKTGHSFGTTSFSIPTSLAFGLELILSFLLMFVIISVATDTRAKGEMAGLAIGSTVAIAAIFAGPLTGASMNPARSLGPALISGHWEGMWLYLVAPFLGAIAGALVYEKIRCQEKPPQDAKGCC
ncbi:MAG: MIP family channel protein [Deltaproteobacteria bacterium]|nr:MIP family channel protein [Deltaproteobacteria bacterium]